MRHSALWLGVLLFFVLAGASHALSEEERTEKIDSFAREILESFGSDRESVVKALGSPSKEAVEKQENRHEEGIEDTFETLEYEGLSLTLGTMSSEKKHWALSLTCTSDRYPLRGLRVGDSIDKVLGALGEPDEKTAEKISYTTDFRGLTLEVDEKGNIQKIESLLWLD